MRAVLFKYGLKQFARRPFASILLLFMFAAIILLIDFTLIKLDGYFRGSELIHDLCKEDCYKLSTDDTYSKIRSDLLNEAYDRIFKDEIEFYDTDYDEMIENGEITEEEVEKIQKEFADKHWKLFEEYEKEEEKIKKQKEEKTEQMEKTKEAQEDIPKVSVKHIEAESKEEALSLIQQEKKEGVFFPKVDISV